MSGEAAPSATDARTTEPRPTLLRGTFILPRERRASVATSKGFRLSTREGPTGHRRRARCRDTGTGSRSGHRVEGKAKPAISVLRRAASCPARHKKPIKGELSCWSGKRGSNPRHPPWQGGALPLSYSRAQERGRISKGSGPVKPRRPGRRARRRRRRSGSRRGRPCFRTSFRTRTPRRAAARCPDTCRTRASRCASGSAAGG
jgi:hypothetical protein